MAEQTEAGYIRACVHAELHHRVARSLIERGHARKNGIQYVGRTQVGLSGGRQDAGTERFCQKQHITWLRARVGQYLVRMHKTGHAQAIFGFFVQNAVAARNDRSSLIDLVIPAAQQVVHRAVRHGFRDAQQIERDTRLAAHRVHIGQGVCRRDLPEQIRIVCDWREKVHSLHERKVIRYPVNRGVVAFVKADQQIGVGVHFQTVQQAGERARADFRAAARAAGELGEFDFLFHKPLLR